MRKKIFFIISIVLFITALGVVYFYKHSSTPKFAIYIGKPDSSSPGNYIVSDIPIITENDISKYYWPDHTIKLKDVFMKNHNPASSNYGSVTIGGSGILNTSSNDIAVIKVNGKEIYRAGFPVGPNGQKKNNYTLVICDNPEVNAIDIIGGYKDSLPNSARNNKELYDILKKLNLISK